MALISENPVFVKVHLVEAAQCGEPLASLKNQGAGKFDSGLP
jgi:hypothetical protein